MKLTKIRELLDAEILCGEDLMETEILSACATDFMSDALAYVKDQGVMLTGMVNPQVIRTAEMMDIICIVFVRGKEPDPAMIELAKEREIALLATGHRMFSACGLLYERGLRGGGEL